jgi:heavy metal sensor kinase
MRSGRRDGLFGTLRFRLTFWNSVVIVLLFGLASLGVRQGLSFTLMRELDRLLDEDALEVSLAVQKFAPDWETVGGMLDRRTQSHQDRGWFGQVLGPDGAVRAASPSVPADGLPPPRRESVTESVGAYRIADRPLDLPTTPGLVIRVGSNLDYVYDDVVRLTQMLLAAGAVVLVVAPVSGYWLAGRATRPLQAIISATARLRPNRLAERLPLRGTGDELDQLSATINASLDRIAEHIGRQREFTAHAAHELRSPLTALRTAIEVALRHDRPAEEYRELLADLAEQSEGLSALINRLLLLAEGDAGSLKPGPEVVSLGRLADKAVEMFRGVAEQRGVRLTAALHAPAGVRGDAHHLRQVLHNLLDNALKFTPAGGAVELEVTAEPGTAVLRVRDTGPGIPPEDLPHVFDRFFRGDRSRSRDGPAGGTGLGLSICRSIVQAYGGRIDLASQPGKGTTATVTLPLAG